MFSLSTLKVAAVAALVGLLVGAGGTWKVRDWMSARAQLAAARADTKAAVKVIGQTQKAAELSQGVGQQVEAEQQQVRIVTRTTIERIPVYVTTKADTQCVVPVGFVRLHDAAAAGSPAPAVPDGSGQSSDAPSGVTLSSAAGAIVGNYGTCHELERQVTGWQSWYWAQKAAWDKGG